MMMYSNLVNANKFVFFLKKKNKKKSGGEIIGEACRMHNYVNIAD